MGNELENVSFEVFNDMYKLGSSPGNDIFSNMLILCYLELLNYGKVLGTLVSLKFDGIIQFLIGKNIFKRVKVLNALIRVSIYQTLQ